MRKLLQFLVVASLLVIFPEQALQAQGGGCECTNCPQFMPDGFTGSFLINVENAQNNTLGQNGQGVCGVVLNFDHEYLGDLSITLTSPSGQSVTLVGPIGLFGGTDFTTWNVTFVPCGDTPAPDPGFSPTWNNNQAWGLFGTYTGSYHPFSGCLENFNSGPVNGTWTLTVVDGQAVDVGNFYDYEIIFCDPTGIDCSSCAANAGNLLQADVSACQGAQSLNLNLPPTYPPNSTEPPIDQYGYTYVIAGPGGVIQAYDPEADLTTYDPGLYTVCGLSFLLTDEGDIPQPDGSLTIAQLTAQLNSTTPPFCGKVTANCVNVNILPAPADVEEYQTICAPGCYTFYGQNYCQSGTYVRNLTQNGCPYTATLYLTVLPLSFKTVNETVCADECSTTWGFESYCGPGTYVEIFTNEAGCDSVVTLNLITLAVQATASQPPLLPCSGGTIQILGTGSSTGPTVTYQWTASNGGHIVGNATGINVLVDAVGDYQLKVCKAGGGVNCCDSTEVSVITNNSPPLPPSGINGANPICTGESVSYSTPPVNGATSYTWTVPAGVTINSGQGTNNINVTWNSTSGGNICVTANNACAPSQPTCLLINLDQAPVASAPGGNASLCAGGSATYSIPAVSGATGYAWTIPGGGVITSGQGTNSINVTWNAAPGGNVCVSAVSDCGAGPQFCLPVTVLAQPVAQAGADGSVCGTNYALQATQSVSGSTGSWSLVSGPGTASFSAPNSPISFVDVSQNGVYSFQWTENNGICSSTDNVTVAFNASPSAGQLDNICDGTGTNYSVTFPIVGGAGPYSVTGGAVSNNTFFSNFIPSGQPYSFVITDANGCTSAAITGSHNCACLTSAGSMNLNLLEACEDETVTATHNNDATLDGNDVTAYVLHTNSGTSLGTVFAQNNTGTFGFQAGMSYGQTYYISLVAGNNSGNAPDLSDPCLDVTQGQPVIFYQNPQANAGIDADTCGQTLPLNASGGPGAGQWNIIGTPGGGALTLTDAQNSSTLATATLFGDYILQWTLSNNGCTDTDTLTLHFNASPATGTVTTTCDATNENFTASFDINGGAAPYTVNNNPVGGGTFTSIFLTNGSSYAFTVVDANGCAAPVVTGAFSCNCATNAGQMNQQLLQACEGASVSAQLAGGQTLDPNDIGMYVLHSNSGNILGTVYDQNATGTFTFQAGMIYGDTYYISYVVANNVNNTPDPADPCYSVSAGQPVVFYQNPVANAGANKAVCGLNTTLEGVSSGNIQWAFVNGPSGATLNIANPADPQSAISASQPGVYAIGITVTENGCVGSDQVQVQFNEYPQLADLLRECDAANENYTVTLTITGGAPPYTVDGASIVGNNFVSTFLPNGQTYNFLISDANGCDIAPVTGAYNCNCATNAGTMNTQTLSACEGQTVSASGNNDQNLDGNDITSFVLHTGAGPALGQVFAQNSTGEFGFQPGMNFGTTYYISLVAGNPVNNLPDPVDPCFSVAPGQPVVFLQNPVPDAGTDASVCGQQASLNAVPGGFPGEWTQVSGPGMSTFGSPNSSSNTVTISTAGTYVYQWTETNQTCPGNDQVQVTFNNLPEVTAVDETCDGTNTQFTVSFTPGGGTAPYAVSGLTGSFSGNTFTSTALANFSSYSFIVTDANGCESPAVSGAHNCNCATDAGTMLASQQTFCADEPAQGFWNNDAFTDANDVVSFILHDQPGAALGTVFATAAQPSFALIPPLQTGVVYYISAIAGNNLGGVVDVNDPCLSIAPGTPVLWKPIPQASLTGDATLCAGQTAVLTFSGTGTYPLTILYSNGSAQQTVNIGGAQAVGINIEPTATTTYTLLSVLDGSSPLCESNPGQSVTITVNQPVSAGTPGPETRLCEGVSQQISLNSLLSNADPGGLWLDVSTAPAGAGSFNAATATVQTAALPAGEYRFQYQKNALAPCESDSSTVIIRITPTPVASAGPDQTITCDQPSVELNGTAGSTGAGATFQWTFNGQNISSIPVLTVSAGGNYTLTATSPEGCTDTDEVVVNAEQTVPFATFAIKGVRCHGDKNGQIIIDSVASSSQPVSFSLDGGAFGNQLIFSPLEAGAHFVTLIDANGCEWTSDTLWVPEPPALSADLGADVLSINLGDSVHLNLDISYPLSALDTIFWYPLLDTARAGTTEQHFLTFNSNDINVRVIDSNGCAVNERVRLLVSQLRHVFIPNIIDPDSDQNNLLQVFGGQEVAMVEQFQVFDRWGELMFEATDFLPNDPNTGWDGKYKGEGATPGVYIYVAVIRFIDGKREIYSGDVTVFKQ